MISSFFPNHHICTSPFISCCFVLVYKSLDTVIRVMVYFFSKMQTVLVGSMNHISVQLCEAVCTCVHCSVCECGSRWCASAGLLGQHFSIYGYFLSVLSPSPSPFLFLLSSPLLFFPSLFPPNPSCFIL